MNVVEIDFVREKMMQQKVNDFEKRTRDEDRCREYKKQAIGFPDEVSPSLQSISLTVGYIFRVVF